MPPESTHDSFPPQAMAGGPSSFEQELIQTGAVDPQTLEADKDAAVAGLLAARRESTSEQPEAILPAAVEEALTQGVADLTARLEDAAIAAAAEETGLNVEQFKLAKARADQIVEGAGRKLRDLPLSPADKQRQFREILRQQYPRYDEAN